MFEDMKQIGALVIEIGEDHMSFFKGNFRPYRRFAAQCRGIKNAGSKSWRNCKKCDG